jgi:hypothetical protein
MAIMPPTREYSPPLEAAAETRIEFDLLDLLLVMAQRKTTIILATILGLFIGMFLVFLVHGDLAKQSCVPDRAGQRLLDARS